MQVGIKPAGGIKTANDALEWMVLIKEELGNEWLTKDYFRIGASSLLDNIKKEIVELYSLGCSANEDNASTSYASETKNKKPEKAKSKKDKSNNKLEKSTS